MSVSRELQTGKAAEHLVCADLILQGYNAFLSDQGMPYDIVVETAEGLRRVQVKAASQETVIYKPTSPQPYRTYRFQFRTGKRQEYGDKSRAVLASTVDFVAFVALDLRLIAYLSVAQMTGKDGHLKITVDWRSTQRDYPGRVYSNGTVRSTMWGGYIFERHAKFPGKREGNDLVTAKEACSPFSIQRGDPAIPDG